MLTAKDRASDRRGDGWAKRDHVRLTAEDVERAFVATALEQEGGAFDWPRVAERLNHQIAKDGGRRSACLTAAATAADDRESAGSRRVLFVDLPE